MENKISMYAIALVSILSVLLLPLASSTITTLKPAKVNTCITLPQTEFNSTFENLTFILMPDKTMNIIDESMVKFGYSYNYSFCNTSQIGIYTANGCSDISCWNYEFEVNKLGTDLSNSKAILYFLMFGLSLILLIIFIYLGYSLPYKNNSGNDGYLISINNLKYLKIIAWCFAYLALMVMMYFAWNISYAYLDLDFVSGLFKVVFYIMALGIVPIFILGTVLIIINAVKDSKIGDELMLGRRIRDE